MDCGAVAQPTWAGVAKVSTSGAYSAVAAVLDEIEYRMETSSVILASAKLDASGNLY